MRIPRFEPGAPVILHLTNPNEKFWGVLGEVGVAGVTLRGIGVASFDDWVAQAARDEEHTLELATMFFPLFRVHRMFLDEPVGRVESFGQRFERRVGRSIGDYLALEEMDERGSNDPGGGGDGEVPS